MATYTYAETLPTDRDWIRWRLDDRGVIVDETTGDPIWIRPNEEYDAILATATDRRIAAADIAESMAIELSKRVDRFTDEDGLSVAWSTRVSALIATARSLRKEVADAAANSGLMAFGSVRAVRIDDYESAEYVSSPVWGYSNGRNYQ